MWYFGDLSDIATGWIFHNNLVYAYHIYTFFSLMRVLWCMYFSSFLSVLILYHLYLISFYFTYLIIIPFWVVIAYLLSLCDMHTVMRQHYGYYFWLPSIDIWLCRMSMFFWLSSIHRCSLSLEFWIKFVLRVLSNCLVFIGGFSAYFSIYMHISS